MNGFLGGGYFRTAESRHTLPARPLPFPSPMEPRWIDKYLILTIAGRAACLTMDTSYRFVPRKVTVSVSETRTGLGPGE